MSSTDIRKLVESLSTECRTALEGASGLCVSRTNYNVELEHWLIQLLGSPDMMLPRMLHGAALDVDRARVELDRAIERFKAGNSRAPVLSETLIEVAREAFSLSRLEFGSMQIEAGHLLIAALENSTAARLLGSASPTMAAIKPEQARALLEEELEGKPGEDAPDAPKAQTAAGAKALEAYTVDLTKQAADGKIDEIRGRDPEIRQVVDILTRRRQNNPILTGEAGVGKTAAVEGFALKLARGEVPETLKDCRLLALDLGLLQAGAGVKGEFERRLKEVIDAVKGSPKPIILFIDEAHNLVGAGGSEGQGDAANLMKPALARGELRTIAATTWAEYKKYFEKDAALARRFQVVKIEEPGEESAIDMLHAISGAFAEHHGTRIRDEALRAAVRLSNRYITGRQLPEKAVGVLDTACARVSLSKATEPGVLEDAKMRLRAIERRIETLEREQAGGIDHAATLQTLGAERDEINERVGLLTEKLEAERAVIEKIYEVRGRAEELAEPGEEGAEPDEAEQKAAIEELNALREELSTLQGEEPLSHHEVDEDAVASVVAAWTGIPVGRMVTDDINAVLRLKEQLCERVVGQDHALEQIAQKVRTSRAQLTDPDKPIGVFLMVGTSGVGKTETGLALADLLYGGEQNLTTINMSEFKEEHKVSLLMGSPPGYVGYGEGGILTEAVRRKPYSVVLLDEMEKAHPGVQDIFYQVFDKGQMKDGQGRDIDFKNTLIIMTSNAATPEITRACVDVDERPDPEALSETIYPTLTETFKPAFLGRCTIIPYYPLADDAMSMIIRLKLRKVTKRMHQAHGAALEFGDDVVTAILERCREVQTGARNIDNILSQTILPELSAEFLQAMADGREIDRVRVSLGGEGFVYDMG